MKKLAVFVEGYTEVVFVEKLIEEIAGKANVRIEHREIRGGSKKRRSFARVRAAQLDTGQRYFVLIVDCGGDHLVKERIQEEHENLTRSGYSKIVGLRDVRPDFTHADIPRLERGLPMFIKTALIPVEFCLAILEIEAWFLAETAHFPRIDPAITLPAIKAALGFDPETDDMEQRLTPADDLNACYAIGGKAYQKHAAKDTVDALDYSIIYVDMLKKFKYLEKLIGSIEAFLAS
jgi:hypothetical protein